jgi:uncharacterized protein with GYD domain
LASIGFTGGCTGRSMPVSQSAGADRTSPEALDGGLRTPLAFAARGTEPGGQTMPMYLTRFSYTPETWAMLIANPEDRRKAAASYIESVGGKLHGFWYAFGSYDGVNLWEAPDNVSMASVVLAIGGGGALSSIETTVLMSVDDTLEALRGAQDVGYRMPGR